MTPRNVREQQALSQQKSDKEQTDATLKFNPFLPEVRENPYPFYEQLRTEDPVHQSFIGGDWLLTRYADIKSVFLDKRFRANDKGEQIQKKNEYASQRGSDLSPLVKASNTFLFYIVYRK